MGVLAVTVAKFVAGCSGPSGHASTSKQGAQLTAAGMLAAASLIPAASFQELLAFLNEGLDALLQCTACTSGSQVMQDSTRDEVTLCNLLVHNSMHVCPMKAPQDMTVGQAANRVSAKHL